jgi:hypothetical protein
MSHHVEKVQTMRISQRAAVTKPADDSDKDKDILTFRKWRRRVTEQIMSRSPTDDFHGPGLSPVAKLVAYSIAERLHTVTRSTPSSNMTLGRPVGLKPDQVQRGLDELIDAGQARISYGENGTRNLLLVLCDIQSPSTPVLAESGFFKTRAYTAFLTARARFLTKLFADRVVSPADKVVAFGATRYIEVEGCTITQTFGTIGSAVGYGAEAVRKSIGRLVTAGYFSKERAPGRKAILTPTMESGTESGIDSGTDSGTSESGNIDGTGVSSPISLIPCDSYKDTYQEDILDSESCNRVREPLTKTLDAAHGQWRTILPSFGIPPGHLNGKHHPCPACGGKDRFRFTNRNGDGDYYCSGCDPGKGISLVAKVNGWTYAEAAKRIDEFIGNEVRKAA